MRAGELRQRVTIQQKSVTRDTTGGEVITWTTFATVWGHVIPLGGTERVRYGLEESEANARIKIRYKAGVVPWMRVDWGDHEYDILEVVDTWSSTREMVLLCREIVSD